MGIIKTKGIIIAENFVNDYDKILVMLTPNLGKISCSAKGARKTKSTLLASTQFLCFGEYKLYKNPTLPLYLELGCGKGYFIANLASEHKDVNYIAIDLVDAMLGLAKRNVEEVYKETNKEPENILLTRFDIERINLILEKADKVERIYINFCNPWPKGKHRKKRLTHSRQLEKYKEFLKPESEIYFKTDDDSLFESSLIYFK